MKTAVLGAGSILPAFLEAAKKVEGLTVDAIFGRESSHAKLEALQKQHGIAKIYHDYGQLLEDGEVEAVYVALPNHLHYPFAKQALEKKKHVIVEKPFAGSYEQARELVELAQKQGMVIFEAISNQYLPNYRKTREILGKVGEVKIVQLNFSQYSRRYDQFKEGIVLPVFDPKQSGGALMDLNVYNIHYVLGLFGKPEKYRYIANLMRGIDTSGILTMEYPSFQCVCVAAKDCKAPASINIQGEKGVIYSGATANAYDEFSFLANSGEEEPYALNGGMPRLYYELNVFKELVKEKRYEEAARYNRHTLEVMEILDGARRQVGIV